MVSGFSSSCGAAKVSPNAQFCHICGASLDPRAQMGQAQARPSGASPMPAFGAPATAPHPAVSPRRATGVTIGIVLATIGFGLVVSWVEYVGYALASDSFSWPNYHGQNYQLHFFALSPIVIMAAFMVIGSFWYGILRLAQKPFAQTWLEALGIGSFAFFLLYFIGASTLFPIFNDTDDPKKQLLGLVIITGIFFSGLGSLIGVGIASSFARWQIFRPQAIGLSLEQIIGLTFGILFLILTALLLLLVSEQNDPILFAALYLPMLLGVAIFGVPFIARGIALDRLRRVRPDLFR
jgi:MFS family permease